MKIEPPLLFAFLSGEEYSVLTKDQGLNYQLACYPLIMIPTPTN